MALKTWSIGAVVCLLAGSASAATTVPAGNVSGTWSALSSPYHVLGNVTVPVGQTLTVDADVVVKFESGMGMTVNGTLSVIGASGQGVTFTSKLDDSVGDDWDGTAGTNGAPGDWTGIFVNTSNSGGVSLSYATIRYGGGGVAGCTTCANLRVNDPTGGSIGPATITNSVIEHSAYAGIYGQNEYLITLSSSTIRNNGTYGVRVAASNVNLAATGSSFDDNGNWAIDRVGLSDIQNIANNSFSHTDGTARFLGVGVTGETLSAARTWPGSNVALVTDPAEPTGPRLAVGAPFVLFSDAAVNGNATITIEAGAVFKLAPGVQIYPYDAVVNANGTEASPIVFTALKDDSVSGDTNADGATAVGAGDYWDRWLFNNDNNGTYPANGTFNYTVFRYGGNTSGLIYARFYPTYLTFNHCTFEYSKTSAFSFSDADGQGSDKRVVINDSLVRNNALYGINAGAEQGRLAVQGTTFSDNGSFAMYGLDVNRLTFLGRLPSGDSSYQAPNVFQNQTVSAGKNLAMVVTGGTSVASGTWPSDGVILIRNQATMAGNCVVSVDPGAVIKFWDAAASLYPYDATLNVNGACPQDGAGNPQPDACLDPATGKDQRVYFTSLKDDVGGDTNGDGGASQPAPGDWLSINFNNDNNASYPANATFSHAVLRYGGAANGMVQTRYLPTNLNFYDSTFASSATAAIYDDGSTDGGSGRLSVQGCRFRDNLGYAVENLHVNRLRYMGRVPAGDGGYSAPNVFLNGDGTTGKQAVAVTRGTAWSNGVWGNDGVIVVRNQPAINNNATITVEPGTVIKFWNTGASLYPYDVTFNVNGACPLDAGGNPQPDTCLDPATGKDQRVYFTSLKDDSVGGDTNGDGATTAAAPGDWDRVYFNNDNTVGYPANGTLRYAVFRYGGFGGGANVEARYYPTYLTFDHCTFERSANAGLSFSAMDGATNEKRIAIYDSVFRDNAGRGIDFVSPARMTIQGSTFSDNGGWAMYGQELNRLIFMGRLPPGDSSYQAANVFVNSDGSTDRLANVIVDGTAQYSGTWGNDGVIVLRGTPIINNNPTITVDPGTIIKFWDTATYLYPYDVTFNVNGACPPDAGGNPQPDTCVSPTTGKDQRVYFTSLKDDSAGGDTNADGAATAPAPGDWDTIYFNNDNNTGYPANGTLSYAVFRYGGFGGGANVEVRFYPTYLTFDHCTFENSASAGLRFSGSDGATNEKRVLIYDSVFRDNAGRGIDFVSPARMTVQGSTFSDNGDWAMYGQELNRLIFMGRLPPGDSSYQAANVFVNSDGSTDRLANVIVDGTAQYSGTWGNDGVIVLRGTPIINNNPTINVDPGTIIKFWDTATYLYPYDVTFNVNGACPPDAGGNPQPDTCVSPTTGKDQRVYFTSLKDDSAGGDTNADDAATAAAPGDWDTIYFNNDNNAAYPANGTLSYAVFRYGGYNGSAEVEVRFQATYVTFANCTFEKSASAGLWVEQTAGSWASPRVVVSGGKIKNNLGYGLRVSNGAPMKMTGATLGDNGAYSINGIAVNDAQGFADGNTFTNTDGSNKTLAIGIDNGTLTSSSTWNNRGAAFVLTGNTDVATGSTLTLAAGAVVKVHPGAYFRLYSGKLTAIGTSAQPIVITSIRDDATLGDTNGDSILTTPAAKDWNYLYFVGSSGNVLDHVRVSYAGSSNAYGNVLWGGTSTGTIANSTFDHGLYGLHVYNGATAIVDACTFEGNVSHGVQVDTGERATITNSVFQNNQGLSINNLSALDVPGLIGNVFNLTGRPGVGVRTTTVSSSITWPALDTPYLLQGVVTVGSAGTLTLQPGTVVKGQAGADLLVNNGRLVADATGASAVVFTSSADDNFFGDTNGGGVSSGNPGQWGGVRVAGASGNATLHNVSFYFGGSGIGAVNLESSATATLTGDLFAQNTWGIGCGVTGSAAAQVSGSTFAGNTEGVHVGATGCANLVIGGAFANRNSLQNNVSFAVNNLSSANVVNARGNYWGSRFGPTHPTNPAGAGDVVSDYVDFGVFVSVTADAGPDHSIVEGERDTLDGTRSFDPDGLVVTYQWTQTGGPAVALSGGTSAHPSYIAPDIASETPLTFALTVSAAGVTSQGDAVVVTIIPINDPPTANAGTDGSVLRNELYFLSGSGSDVNLDPITAYSWQQQSGPPASLSNAASATPSFTAPNVSVTTPVVFELRVQDNEGAWSPPDSVTVSVLAQDSSRIVSSVAGQSGAANYLGGAQDEDLVYGETVTISGTGLDDVMRVLMNGELVDFTGGGSSSPSSTSISFVVPPGMRRGPVKLQLNGVEVPEAAGFVLLELVAVGRHSAAASPAPAHVELRNGVDGTLLRTLDLPFSDDFQSLPMRMTASGRFLLVGSNISSTGSEGALRVDLVTAAVGAKVGTGNDGIVDGGDWVDESRAVAVSYCAGTFDTIDFAAGTNVGNVYLAGGANATYGSDVAVLGSSGYAAVANQGASSVSIVSIADFAAPTVAQTINLGALSAAQGGGTGASAIAASPDGHWLLVTNSTSSTVSVIELTAPSTFSVRAPALSVPANPQAVDVADDGSRAYVLSDSATAGGDALTMLDLGGALPAIIGAPFVGLSVTTNAGTGYGCGGPGEYNNVLLDASYTGDRVYVAAGVGGPSEYYEVVFPPDFPASSAVVAAWSTNPGIGKTEGIAVQPGLVNDATAPQLVEVSLHDGDGLLAVGAEDYVELRYGEQVSPGAQTALLSRAGSFAALVAELGLFSDPGTLTGTACTLVVADDTIRVVLGGVVSGTMELGGTFAPLAGSVDDAAGNLLDDVTPVAVTGGFGFDFEPTFAATQVQDNSHIRVRFDAPVAGGDAASCWTVTYPPSLGITVSAVTAAEPTTLTLTTQTPMLVGFTYTVSACAAITDTVNGLHVNNLRSTRTFTAVDLTAPTFSGLATAVDASTTRPADGEIDLGWTPALDNGAGSITYRIYYSFAPQDPLTSAYKQSVTGATSTRVIGLVTHQTYAFAVRAEDAAGNRDQNTVVRTATPEDSQPPYWGTGTGVLTAADTNEGGSVVLTFGNASDVSSNPVQFNIYAATSLGALFSSAPVATTSWAAQYEIGGLTNGVTYYVGVRAEDAAGNEDANIVYRTVVPNFDATPPTFAGLATAVDDGTDGTVRLGWAAATETTSLPLTYDLYWSTAAATVFSAGAKVSGVTATSYVVDALTNDRAYYFAVRAQDGVGNVDSNSVVLSATPTVDNAVPSFAGIVSATDLGSNATVRITWGAASDLRSPPVVFDLYYDQSEANLFAAPRIAGLSAAMTQYVVGGLAVGVPWYFGVRARDARGNRDPNAVALSATPTLDATPPGFAGLAAAAAGASGGADLLWAAATEATSLPVRYRVFQASAADAVFAGAPVATIGYQQVTCASGVVAQFCATGLANGVVSYFGVRAADAVGNVDDNAVVRSVTPQDTAAPAISGLSVTPVTAAVGDVVTVTFNVSEPLFADPAVLLTIDGQGGDVTMQLSGRAGLRYTYTYGVTGTEEQGTRAISIDVADLAANSAHAATAVVFDFVRDLSAPTVLFVSPVDGDRLNDARPDVLVTFDDTANGTDPTSSGLDCTRLELRLDNQVVFAGCAAYDAGTGIGWSATGVPMNALRYRPPADLAFGVHLLSARISDIDGNQGTPADVSVTIVRPDQVALSPGTARLAPGQRQTFAASYSGDVSLCVWNDALAGGTLDATTGGSVTLTAADAAGHYTLSVECPDATTGGTQQTTASVQVLNLLSLQPASATIAAGDVRLFVASSDLSGSYAWSISGGGSLVPDPDDARMGFRAGYQPGQFLITVSDVTNNLSASAPIRIVPPSYDVGQAIIVAGGSMNDHLWSDTRALTAYAYATLQARGLTDEAIYFMSQSTTIDLDGDGTPEVDALAESDGATGLRYAIETWAAAKPGSPLFIYLVDHGSNGSLWIGDADGDGIADATELLAATDLGAWLDTLAAGTPITVVYEACKSGSFVSALSGADRVIITTAGAENATLALDGNISFSQYWLAALSEGNTVGEAFDIAGAAMAVLSAQVPQLDDDGDGVGNGPQDGAVAAQTWIGFPFAGTGAATSIATVRASRVSGQPAPAARGERAQLDAVVTGIEPITEVYALVVPPSWVPPPPAAPFETPELDLARVNLVPSGAPDAFVGLSPVLTEVGTYRFIVYARDQGGRRALPKQVSLAVVNPPPTLVALALTSSGNDVAIDSPVDVLLEDADGVSPIATRLFVNDVDVTASAQVTATTATLQLVYVPDLAHHYPNDSTIPIRIETSDLATPPASTVYTRSFTTGAPGLSTSGHQPARYSTGNSPVSLVRVHVTDAAGFGVNPGSLELRVNGELVAALIAEGDPINDPGSLEDFVLSYLPSTPFAPGAVAVEIRARDISGHVMEPDRYWFFVGSVVSGDTTPPEVTALAPADGASGVAVDADIGFTVEDDNAVNFNTIRVTLDEASAPAAELTVGARGVLCTPDAVLGAARVACVIDPVRLFVGGESVTLTIAVADTSGNAMSPLMTSFTTAGETVPPAFVARLPAPGASGVAVGAAGSFTVADAGSGVDLGSVAVTVNGAAVTVDVSGTPAAAAVAYGSGTWEYSTAYTVVATAIDENGNSGQSSWSFVTDTGLRVLSVSPPDGTQGVPVTTGVSLVVTDVAGLTIDQSSIRLLVSGVPVTPTSVTGTGSQKTISYQPASPLPYGRSISLSLEVADARGHQMPTFRSSFSTVSDTEPPYVVAVAPAPDATGVSADVAVTVDLRDDGTGVAVPLIDVGLGAAVYRLGSPGFSYEPRANGVTVTVRPADLFYPGDVVPVVVNARDGAGNIMPQLAYAFTVGNETEPPVAVYLAPKCRVGGGTSGIARTAPIVVELSDTGAGVDPMTIDFKVDGVVAAPVGMAGDARRLLLTYRPAFGYGVNVTAEVRASDLTPQGNPMAAYEVLSYTTTTITDSDSDGMPDDFERCYFVADGVSALPGADADGDGASNLQEYRDGTNPIDASDVESATPDAYENDDTVNLATAFVVGSAPQLHNFHQDGDVDWLSFEAVAGQTYRIATGDLQGRADTVLGLYDAAGENLLAFNNDARDGVEASEVVWTVPPGSGTVTYLIKVFAADLHVFGAFTGYWVGVFGDAVAPTVTELTPANGARIAEVTPIVSAVITDDNSGVAAASVRVRINDQLCAHAFDEGTGAVSCTVTSPLAAGTHVLEVSAQDVAGNRGVGRSVFSVTDFAVSPSSASLVIGDAGLPFTVVGGTEPLQWSTAAGTLAVSGDTRGVTLTPGTASGAFELVAIDANGRQTRAEVTVVDRLVIRPSFASVGFGDSVTLDAVYQGTGTFSWEVGGDGTLDLSAGPIVTFTAGSTAGLCVVTVTEAGSGATATASVNVLATNVGEAIIIAATGAEDAAGGAQVEAAAEQAYRAMIHRGFNRDRIHFLTGVEGVPFDGDENGLDDDVDGPATRSALLSVLTQVLPGRLGPGVPLTIYWVGGSLSGAFALNASEAIGYAELASLIDALDHDVGMRHLAFVADVGYGAGAAPQLAGDHRVFMSSTAADEQTSFAGTRQGSFSYAFFNRIFLGESVGGAFSIARATTQVFGSTLTPAVDDNGDGIVNEKEDGPFAAVTYIGEPGIVGGSPPVIATHAPDLVLTSGTSADLWATVLATELVAAVEVTIIPPTTATAAVRAMALPWNAGANRYELDLSGFIDSGVYRVVYAARDVRGRSSLPVEATVTTPGPYLTGLYPPAGSKGAAANTLVYFTLHDAGADLNLASLSVMIDGVERAAACTTAAVDPRLVYVTCTPAGVFGLGTPVAVTIAVSDANSVAMPPYTFTFTTTDGIDAGADGLPDDFQGLLGAYPGPVQDADGDGVDNSAEFGAGTNPIASYPPDDYEDDDQAARATPFVLSSSQRHTFHDRGDEDWVSFACAPFTSYEVATSGLGGRADTVVDVFLGDRTTLLRSNDDYDLVTAASRALVACVTPQTLYVRVRNYDPEVFGPDTGYTLGTDAKVAATGALYGSVVDDMTGAPLPTASLELDFGVGKASAVPYPDGTYLLDAPPGSGYRLFVSAPDYEDLVIDAVTVEANTFTNLEIRLVSSTSLVDTDGDGMPDAWETSHGLEPNDPADWAADPDGDGRNNLDEYLNGSDPWLSNAPTAPVIDSPADGARVVAPVTLTVFNATDVDSVNLTYFFVVEAVAAPGVTVEASGAVAEGTGRTSWLMTAALTPSMDYRFTAYASDGQLDGPSSSATFTFVLPNQPPAAPTPFAPANGTVVATLTPALAVTNAADPDGDVVSYDFEVYTDLLLMTLVEAGTAVQTAGRTTYTVATALADQASFAWRARALDATSRTGPWSTVVTFSTDATNEVPPAPAFVVPATAGEVLAPNPPQLEITGVGVDGEGEAVTYRFVIDTSTAYDGALKQESGAISVDGNGHAVWQPPVALATEVTYWLRVVGNDGTSDGPAAETAFSIAAPPIVLPAPVVIGPKDLAEVGPAPTLSVEAAIDPLGRALTYEFEVYSDVALTTLVASTSGVADDGSTTRWTVAPALTAGQVYSWRARAVDPDSRMSDWSATAMFMVAAGGDPGPDGHGSPAGSGCGCRAGGSGASLVMLLCCWLVLRRVRRARCA